MIRDVTVLVFCVFAFGASAQNLPQLGQSSLFVRRQFADNGGQFS